jgi:hypothetical protein
LGPPCRLPPSPGRLGERPPVTESRSHPQPIPYNRPPLQQVKVDDWESVPRHNETALAQAITMRVREGLGLGFEFGWA